MMIPRRRPTLPISKFFKLLGCKLHNTMWSWAAISDEKRQALFTMWADQLVNGRMVIWEKGDAEYKRRNGGKELIRIIEATRERRYDAFGVICYAKDVTVLTRERQTYDDSVLLVLRFVDEDEGIVAYVDGETSPKEVLDGRGRTVFSPVRYALSDLDSPPIGNENPDRAQSTSNDYRRDPAVREFVIRQAGGRCEFCKEVGFPMPNGRRYLEAHHVIALASDGADTVSNVIALCPSHHREAHYGVNAETLEEEFVQIIAQREAKNAAAS